MMNTGKVLALLFGVLAAAFAAAFAVHFMLFQTRGYSCVHGIQMIFYGMNAWGFGILAAVFGGRK